jgi:biopolymer transport protein ExbD
MLRPRTKPTNLIRGIDLTGFSLTMAGITLTLLTIFMMYPTPNHHGISVDLPKINHPISMERSTREDTLSLMITRDGQVFFGDEEVLTDQLPGKISRALSATRERKIYIRADARARYGTVKEALDAIRDAGVENVAFLAREASQR